MTHNGHGIAHGHLGRIFNTPLMVDPNWLAATLPAILETLARNYPEGPQGSLAVPAQERAQALISVPAERSEASGLWVYRGVAILPIYGPLVHRGRYDANCMWMTGYGEIVRAVQAADADPAVHTMVGVFDTPGGEVAGLDQAAEAIAAARKPFHGAISESAASAGFRLAAAASSRSITRTGIAGSVGVYWRHTNVAKMLAREGVEITELYYGARKTDGTPIKALPPDVRERIQARIDALGEMFVAAVAESLGMDPQAVRDTQADIYMGEAAVEIGFADRIESADAMIERLAAEGAQGSRVFIPGLKGPGSTQQEANAMALSVAIAAALGISAEAPETEAVAKIQSLSAAAAQVEGARAEGAKEERERVLGILSMPEAQGREQQAIAFAKVPAMTPEAAKDALAAIPAGMNVEAQPKQTEFQKHMAKHGNPDIGADADDPGEQDIQAKEAAQLRERWGGPTAGAQNRYALDVR